MQYAAIISDGLGFWSGLLCRFEEHSVYIHMAQSRYRDLDDMFVHEFYYFVLIQSRNDLWLHTDCCLATRYVISIFGYLHFSSLSRRTHSLIPTSSVKASLLHPHGRIGAHTKHIHQFGIWDNVWLHLVPYHGALLEGIGKANERRFAPRGTYERDAESVFYSVRGNLRPVLRKDLRNVWACLHECTTHVSHYGLAWWVKAQGNSDNWCSHQSRKTW